MAQGRSLVSSRGRWWSPSRWRTRAPSYASAESSNSRSSSSQLAAASLWKRKRMDRIMKAVVKLVRQSGMKSCLEFSLNIQEFTELIWLN
ncbi:hypothetical protein GH733_014812 [Mirounga leonina]|nr:hypothetical protein GH733_014812 [Mirounga leonina]